MDLEIRRFEPADETVVIQLWKDCGLVVLWNDPAQDIQRKMRVQPELFLVGCHRGRVVATVMAGYEGHRGWINYLAVAPNFRRQGMGRRMMEEAEACLNTMGCPKINLQVRKTNVGVIAFYKAIGFAEDPVVSLGKRLITDGG